MSSQHHHHHHGHSHKHTSQHKHSGTSKHHQHHQRGHHQRKSPYAGGPLKATVKARHPHHAKGRGLAAGGEWECCVAEALGASLRLAGWPVGDEDVLALHVAAGGSRHAGVPILAALEAAADVGLAGVRPRWFGPLEPGWDAPGVILGAELPGAHALTLDGPGVWSWGEWHSWSCFPGAVLEEAWAVVWP